MEALKEIWGEVVAKFDDPPHPAYEHLKFNGEKLEDWARDYNRFESWALSRGYVEGCRLLKRAGAPIKGLFYLERHQFRDPVKDEYYCSRLDRMGRYGVFKGNTLVYSDKVKHSDWEDNAKRKKGKHRVFGEYASTLIRKLGNVRYEEIGKHDRVSFQALASKLKDKDFPIELDENNTLIKFDYSMIYLRKNSCGHISSYATNNSDIRTTLKKIKDASGKCKTCSNQVWARSSSRLFDDARKCRGMSVGQLEKLGEEASKHDYVTV